MFKATKDKKDIVELSIKQTEQWLTYQFDKFGLKEKEPIARASTPHPCKEEKRTKGYRRMLSQ